MKKTIVYLLFLLMLPASSFANFYLDIYSAYVNAGDAENQFGAGGALLMDISSQTRAMFRSTYTFNILDKTIAGTEYEVTYNHFSGYGGIEFTPVIPILESYRLKWRNTFLAGYAMTGVRVKAEGQAESNDAGMSLAFLTGIGWEWRQHFSFFMDVGWHQSFCQNDFKNSKIYGIEAFLGVRCALFPSRSISEDY